MVFKVPLKRGFLGALHGALGLGVKGLRDVGFKWGFGVRLQRGFWGLGFKRGFGPWGLGYRRGFGV